MLIINFMILLMMMIGLLCTLVPRLYGTVMILLAATIYAITIGGSIFATWVPASLLLLTLLAEVGVRGLRIVLTRQYPVSRIYSVDTTVCNLVGIVVADALLGPVVGISIWESLVGRALIPRFASISKVLIRLMLTAVLRFLCGATMVIIVVRYMMYIP